MISYLNSSSLQIMEPNSGNNKNNNKFINNSFLGCDKISFQFDNAFLYVVGWLKRI